MKTIRLLYPDYISGNLEEYFLGSRLMAQIVPQNDEQKLCVVDLPKPDSINAQVENGIFGKDLVLEGISKAQAILASEKPEKIITIGGNCLVSLVPFDYLHHLYQDVGIVWIDAHPDVSTPKDGYPNAHAMVLGSLLGGGASFLREKLVSPYFSPQDLLYIGLQDLHSYQKQYLDDLKVDYEIQTQGIISDLKIKAFLAKHSKILVHLDIDVLDPKFFAATYFANPTLVGDGSGGGIMTLERLSQILALLDAQSSIMGLTIAEYLPFAEFKLQKAFEKLKIFA